MNEVTKRTENSADPTAPVNGALAPMLGDNPALVFTPEVFKNLLPVAEIMAKSGPAVPQWLRQNPGGCFSICISALQWHMNPFGLAGDSYCVEGGTVAFGAKSTHAIVEKVCGESFEHEFNGDWDQILGNVEEKTSTKTGKKYYAPAWRREDEKGLSVSVWLPSNPARKLTLRMTQCTVRNSTNWANNPQLQLFYQACKVWARMYKPGAMLGVYSVDEMPEERAVVDVTPDRPGDTEITGTSRAEKLKKRLGIGEAGSVETVSEKKREDYAKKPARRSELIRQALEESGAPVSYEEVERYLKEKAAVGEIDNDSSWPFAVRERFDADVRKSVTAVANEIADKLI